MKHFLKTQLWPVVVGLLVAFIVMMIFEFVNSFFFPLPEGLDTNDVTALHAFTATLPWTAYILIFLGWVLGAFKAGYYTTRLSQERVYRLSCIVGIILTIGGILNNIIIGHSLFFNIIGLPMFMLFTYAGHRYFLKRHRVVG